MATAVDMAALRKAAEQGDPAAQYELGRIHEYGKEGAVDFAAAAKWYRLAAETGRQAARQGDAQAQLQLGRMYEYGHGVAVDYGAAAG